MFKKINCLTIIGLSSFSCIVVGMKEEDPVLAINDYIIPVSNAYEALKKEYSLVYDVMKRASFERINEHIREANNTRIPTICRIQAKNGYLEKTRSLQIPSFMYIKISYEKSLEASEIGKAQLSITPYIYTVFNRATFTPAPCERDKRVKKICLGSENEKGENKAWQWLAFAIQYAMQELKKQGYQQKKYCIELCSDKRVSDWIFIREKEESAKPLKKDNSVFKACPLIPGVVLVAAIIWGLSLY